MYQIESWHFHWKFWKPQDCIGGPIYFGWWAVCVSPDGKNESKQSAWQVSIKQSCGDIKP